MNNIKNTTIIVFIALFALAGLLSPSLSYSEKLVLSAKDMKTRIRIFYPLKKFRGSEYKAIKKLMRQENWAQAVAQAEQIHKSHPENMKKAYYFQTVKSYSLVTSDWRRIEVPPSSLLTFHAWLELTNQNYDETIALTKKCVDIYSNDALIQQSRLADFLSKKEAHNAGALNNVATCFYIMGQSFFSKRPVPGSLQYIQKDQRQFFFFPML